MLESQENVFSMMREAKDAGRNVAMLPIAYAQNAARPPRPPRASATSSRGTAPYASQYSRPTAASHAAQRQQQVVVVGVVSGGAGAPACAVSP